MRTTKEDRYNKILLAAQQQILNYQNNQRSFVTRVRYADTVKRFAEYLEKKAKK